MAATRIQHPSVDERRAKGKEARERTPLSAHSGWEPAADRPDPVALLEAQNTTREPDLVPVRHGRMMVSPFTFYRGAAKIMAADLEGTPTAGLRVQLCGDAHLSNFGVFASPERVLLFDLNDFDETLPGPVRVRRQAHGGELHDRGTQQRLLRRGHGSGDHAVGERVPEGDAASSREMRTMDVWHSRLSADEILEAARSVAKGKRATKEAKGAEKAAAKARTRDSLQALSKLGEMVDGRYRIVSQPPIVVPMRELAAYYSVSPDEIEQVIHEQFRGYRATLQDDRRHLLERFEVVDMARKVVGVGSVGTRAFIVLLQGRDEQDPLFLQVKEATASVLEDHLPRSRYKQHGERVVQGQRLMQAASDIYLGWTKGAEADRYFYWRQLRDMKGSADVETMQTDGMTLYARICGWTLARAHARSGDAITIAKYLGKGDAFDRSITDFSTRYADQNERDFQAFLGAAKGGRVPVLEGV